MDLFLERIQEVINKLFKGNQAAFARAIGIKPTTLSNYFSDKKATKPSSEFALLIAQNIGVDGNWLLTGSGDMGVEVANTETKQGDKIDTHAPNSPGKIVGNVKYDQRQQVRESIKEKTTEEIVEIHCPEDLYKIEVLTLKVDFLTSENKKQEATIADLRDRVTELKARINELKGKKQ